MGQQAHRAPDTNPIPNPDLGDSFLQFIGSDTYPCVGARFALTRDAIETHEFGVLGDPSNDQVIFDGLSRFVTRIESIADDDDAVHSYVAIFAGPIDMTERHFESSLWTQLWRLHTLDVRAGYLPAEDVSNDTNSPQFSLSLAGHPFFLIGLHPHASRLARQFTHPVLVFNSHRQFNKLKADGRFEKMQTATRSRDIELQGSLNPNLAEYGDESEARQYSGREVELNWQCPFDFREKQ
ncbi:MAG: guanitoxin biosynthesis heme-dependent pre-guanitoxin N-hydroxylase GntA [Pseudohongiella sp.]